MEFVLKFTSEEKSNKISDRLMKKEKIREYSRGDFHAVI